MKKTRILTNYDNDSNSVYPQALEILFGLNIIRFTVVYIAIT